MLGSRRSPTRTPADLAETSEQQLVARSVKAVAVDTPS
jgi:hypothetical protein